MEATVSGEYPTRGANCSCVSRARLRKVLTTSPNILRMYCGSGSPPERVPPLPKVPYVVLSMPSVSCVPCVMYGYLPVRLSWSATRPCSRNVTRTVYPSHPYADSAYGSVTWWRGGEARNLGAWKRLRRPNLP